MLFSLNEQTSKKNSFIDLECRWMSCVCGGFFLLKTKMKPACFFIN